MERVRSTKADRERTLQTEGYPAYTTSAGWIGYSDDRIRDACRDAIADGWTHFKVKVGASPADDYKRVALVREAIGPDRTLMIDANQRWDVDEAIARVNALAEFNLHWIEEPTSPDDVLGHARIARAVHPIGVATGEHCANRVLFKQLLQAHAISFCQIDSCRLGGVNENLAVILMAAKFGVPVCPHAGGVGLCELVQHLSMFDYIAVSGTLDGRVTEFVDHLHEHFVHPVVIRRARYMPPTAPGYSSEIKAGIARPLSLPSDGPAVWSGSRLRSGMTSKPPCQRERVIPPAHRGAMPQSSRLAKRISPEDLRSHRWYGVNDLRIVRASLAHGADGLRPIRLRRQAGHRDHQHLERHQPLPRALQAARRGRQARRLAGGRVSRRAARR